MVDMVVVLEEMGKVVFPGPFFASAILGGIAIDLGGSDAQKQKWLPGLADGSLRATLAQVEGAGAGTLKGSRSAAKAAGGGFTLSGDQLFVHDAHNADLLIVPVRTGGKGTDGVTMLVVERKAKGVAVRMLKTMDQTRKLCEVTFDGDVLEHILLSGPPGLGKTTLAYIIANAMA